VLAALLIGAALAASPATVATAGHHGTWTGEGLTWESTFVMADMPLGGGRIELAVPLPGDVQVTSGRPARVVPVYDENGEIVALDVEGFASREIVTLVQPAEAGELALHAPLAVGEAVQRVTLDGATFEPDPGVGVERRIADARQSGVSRKEKRRVDKELGRARPSDHPMYVVADTRVKDAGGLVGELVPSGQNQGLVAGAIGAAFVATLAGLALLRRFLAKMAEAEEVDAYIKKEFVRFDPK
jgi:hypothetical protein